VDKLVYEEDHDFDLMVMGTCIECKTMSLNEEIGICHNCSYKSVTPQIYFYEDKMKYLRTLLNKNNNWYMDKDSQVCSYEDYMHKYSLILLMQNKS